MKPIYITFIYCLLANALLAQVIPHTYSAPGADIVYAEYFFDADPGFGGGTSITLTPGSDVNLNFEIDVNALSTGAHVLHVRAQDGDGKWSMMQHSIFFTGSSGIGSLFPAYDAPGGDIVEMEYFFDTDPGEGMGTALPITTGPDVTYMGMIDVNALSTGSHVLHVRAKDASGKWSMMQHSIFFTGSSGIGSLFPAYDAPGGDIVEMEYFIDADPGEGNGTDLPITPGPDVTYTGMIDVDALPAGAHVLHVRAKDASGKWTMMQHDIFFRGLNEVINAFPVYDAPGGDIVEVEYFIDADPGFGNGYKWDVTAGQDITVMDIPCIDQLSPGTHYLHVRAKDASGKWSLMQHDEFTIASGCHIYLTEITTTCDDNSTPYIFTDDTFDVGLFVSSTDATNSFNVSGDITGAGANSCFTPAIFDDGGTGYPYTGTDLNITVADSGDPSCTMDSTVAEPVPPPVACQDITVQLDAMGMATIQLSNVTTSNTCGAMSVVLGKSSFTCADVGPNAVMVTQTDHKGTVTNCISNVTVADTVKPMVITQDLTAYLDASGNVAIVAADVDNGSSDACGIASMMLDNTAFDCSDVGANTVTLTVTDNNGNVQTGTAVVTVEDPDKNCCVILLNIPDNPIMDDTYRAEDIISTGLVPVGGDVIFKAGNCITLNPGFEVELGALFEALIVACPN